MPGSPQRSNTARDGDVAMPWHLEASKRRTLQYVVFTVLPIAHGGQPEAKIMAFTISTCEVVVRMERDPSRGDLPGPSTHPASGAMLKSAAEQNLSRQRDGPVTASVSFACRLAGV